VFSSLDFKLFKNVKKPLLASENQVLFFRLLEINGVSVLGKTQQDVVNHLRSIEIGSTVHITVSRHVENMPRKLVRFGTKSFQQAENL